MDITLHESLARDPRAQEAASAIEACVHCGFCLATCPTYLDSRDERDSPRGRIYLLRELLETGTSDSTAQSHLDRCLTCRSCETTCPSGVEYGRIVDAGRDVMETVVPRTRAQRLLRGALLTVVPRPRLFEPLLRVGQLFRPLLPAGLRQQIPARQKPAPRPVAAPHARRVVLLEGCVQGAATPNSNNALRQLLDRLGIAVIDTPGQGCCGALRAHLSDTERARDDMRRNIDCWWPAIEAGAEALISSATGCGSQLSGYGHALRDDPAYASKAARVAELSEDAAAFLLRQPRDTLGPAPQGPRVAVHTPCSQTHMLQQPDSVRVLLRERGFQLTDTVDDHLCCGSAGSYSLLQPAMSKRLRERKLEALCGDQPEVIVSANIGCQLHLAAASEVPVRHWAELMLESLG